MKKHTLILGPSLKKNIYHAEKLIQGHSKSQRNFCPITQTEITSELFSACNENTKTVIIYNLLSPSQIESSYPFTRNIPFYKKENPITSYIEPVLIIISTNISPSDIPSDASFTERFNVMNLYNINLNT